jgi:hypothetical protein
VKRRKKLVTGMTVTALTALAAVPSGASAAHCTDRTGTTPGFSYFGTVHVKQDAHDREGGNPGPHMGTPGASNCRDTTGSPSDRAPGRN